jgi:hypothetical protein
MRPQDPGFRLLGIGSVGLVLGTVGALAMIVVILIARFGETCDANVLFRFGCGFSGYFILVAAFGIMAGLATIIRCYIFYVTLRERLRTRPASPSE